MTKLDEYTEKPSEAVASLLAEFEECSQKIDELKSQPDYKTNPEFLRLLGVGMDLTLQIYRAAKK